jgi:hypothetical protein
MYPYRMKGVEDAPVRARRVHREARPHDFEGVKDRTRGGARQAGGSQGAEEPHLRRCGEQTGTGGAFGMAPLAQHFL